VAIGLEGDVLAFGCPALRATKLVVRQYQGTQMASNGKVLKRDVRMVVDMHTATAMLTDSFLCGDFKRTVVDKDRTP
jgi:hypothetical protein